MDEGPWNGLLERPALRALVPPGLAGAVVLDAGCGSGAQAEWLLGQGADVIGIDVSPRMVEEAVRRCAGRGWFFSPTWRSRCRCRRSRWTESPAHSRCITSRT
jgi:SAM-dependent methyltransferase